RSSLCATIYRKITSIAPNSWTNLFSRMHAANAYHVRESVTFFKRVLVQTMNGSAHCDNGEMPIGSSTLDLFKGRHFDREIIVLCVRWYLSFKLSFRDLIR